MDHTYTLGIDIGSTTVKIAILDETHQILFSDYKRHFANIRETLSSLLQDAYQKLGNLTVHPVITGSGGLTLANHLKVPFVQEVVAVATSLKEIAPKTDVAIELGGEDAKTPVEGSGIRLPQECANLRLAKITVLLNDMLLEYDVEGETECSPE